MSVPAGSLYARLSACLAADSRAGLERHAERLRPRPGALDFLSNDSLGLADDAAWRQTLARCVARWAPSGQASWVAGGRHALAEEAAATYAAYFGAAECRFFASGYQAHLAAVAGLLLPGQPLLVDRRMHASATRFLAASRARIMAFAHADMAHLDRRLLAWQAEAPAEQAIVMTESLFSMDGSLTDLGALHALKKKYGFFCWVDEAHTLGACGPDGRGCCAEHAGLADLLLGSFGKALGYWGAFLLLPAGFGRILEQRSSPLMHTTALPPAHAAGALALLERLPRLEERRQELASKAAFFRHCLHQEDLPVQGQAHIVAIPVGDARRCARWADRLAGHGMLVLPARWPTVPHGQALLRCNVRVGHSADDLRRAARLLRLCQPEADARQPA